MRKVRSGVPVVLYPVFLPEGVQHEDVQEANAAGEWRTWLPARPVVGDHITIHLDDSLGLALIVDEVHLSDLGKIWVSVRPEGNDGWV